MSNILIIPTSGTIIFSPDAAGASIVSPLSSSPRLSYDGAGGISITSYTTAPSALNRLVVDGSAGRLFSVSDALTGTIFTVNDISGLPIIKVDSNILDVITMGAPDTNTFVITNTSVGIGTTTPNQRLTVVGGISSTDVIFASGGNSNLWSSTYTTVNSYSGGWGIGTVGTGAYLPLSGGTVTGQTNVQNVLSSNNVIYANSGNSNLWNSTYNNVNTNSGSWNSLLSAGNFNFTGTVSASSLKVNFIDFNPLSADSIPPAPPYKEGRLYYDNDDHTLSLAVDTPDISLQIGQEMWIRAVNKTPAILNLGTVVYLSGNQGNRPMMWPAKADLDLTSADTVGIVGHNVAINAEGYVITAGILKGINTTDYIDGGSIYLSPLTAGKFTATKPVAPEHLVKLGWAMNKTNNGSIMISVDNGYELDELHDVKIVSPSDNQYLSFSGTTWINKNDTVSPIVQSSSAKWDDTSSKVQSNSASWNPSGIYFLPLSGGTVTGVTSFQSLLSANRTITDALTSGGTITWKSGLGAISQILGPTDQALKIAVPTPVAAASAQAGNALTLLAGNAIGGLTINGSAAGGNVTITGGAAHQGLAANSANGGTVTITGGAPSQNGDPGNVAIVGGVGTFKTSGAEGAITLTTPAAENRITGGAIIVTTGVGGLFGSGVSNGTGAGGGPITFTSGAGGSSAADLNPSGGAGGTLSVTLGAGGAAIKNGAITAAVGGGGGSFSVAAGPGGASTTASSGTRTGGNGGSITLSSGQGGDGTTVNGNGGSITISTGLAGAGAGSAGTSGSILFNTGSTNQITISPTTTTITNQVKLEKVFLDFSSNTSIGPISTDSGKIIQCTATASSITVTLPTGLSTGWNVTYIQATAQPVTFTSAATINSFGGLYTTAGQWASVTVVCTASNTFLLYGNLA